MRAACANGVAGLSQSMASDAAVFVGQNLRKLTGHEDPMHGPLISGNS